ncbi:family 78 glycoside hydrolase catalytic domain [Streptomyces sp. NPDC102364]|uniref:alpha-L-rhamnosidase n=1 Tax=Streptomyces sp. NPDC102364 TaxID=3366161 RepID=UPI0037F28841
MTTAPTFVSGPRAATEGDPAPYFRRDLDITPGLRRATLHVTGLGIVEAYVNGTRVGDEILSPGWTSYEHRVDLRRHDVTGLLTEGRNTLGAIVGEGWAVGPLSWELKRGRYADRPALYARLELEYADRIEVVGTDEEFRVGEGAVRANGIYHGESYDARLEPTGWSEPGFDDTAWAQVRTSGWDLGALVPDAAPPIRRIEELTPVEIHRRDDGRFVVDFGQVLTGWVRITVSGEAGRTITLRHAELLTPGGELETETLRKAAATDRYTLRGSTAEAPETWEPRFTFHGFRYVEVTDWPGELLPNDLSAVVVHSDMARTGWFSCSNQLVTRLHTNTVWSMRGNFVGVPTDCPQRDERLGWTGDLNAFAPTAVFLYDVRGVLRSWLDDLAAEHSATGTVPWTVPDALPHPSSAAALWSDVAVNLPWTLYQEYGDAGILRRAYPSMVALVAEIAGRLDEHGLWSEGFQFGDWLAPDAPADNPAGGGTDRYLVAQAYLCRTTRQLADTARVLGEDADAPRWAALAERVLAAFRTEYVTPAGRLACESQTAYALAITFVLLDEKQRAKAGDRLAALVEEAGHTIATGFAGTPLITDALSATGHLDTAYKLLLQTRCPSFLYPVTQGATTVWERWDAVLPDGRVNATGMTSLNHYALGAVADWLHRVVGGLQRTSPGWRTLRIAPRPGGLLTSASVAHETPLGRAACDWHVVDGEMRIDVLVPDDATAVVELPLHPEGFTEEVGGGRHTWRYPAPAGYGEAVRLTLDSPVKAVMEDTETWARVREVLVTAYPDMPIDAAGTHLDEAPLSVLVEHFAGSKDELRDTLAAALTDNS